MIACKNSIANYVTNINSKYKAIKWIKDTKKDWFRIR